MSHIALDAIVYFVYKHGGNIYQVIGIIEHIDESAKQCEIRVADKAVMRHTAATLPAQYVPRVIEQHAIDVQVVRVPFAFVIQLVDRENAASYEHRFSICTASLVGKRVRINGTQVGRVTHDCIRNSDKGHACQVRLDSGQLVRVADTTFLEVAAQHYAHIRQAYRDYLKQAVTAVFGPMKRHTISAVWFDNDDDTLFASAFTYTNCYLPAPMQLNGPSLPDFACTVSPASTVVPEKRDVIYGYETERSKQKPHVSGRKTLYWVNATRQEGLDEFIKFFLAPELPGKEWLASMRAKSGAETIFSRLAAGCFEGQPLAPELMCSVFWEYEC